MQLKTDSNTLSNLAFADFNNDGESDVFRADGSKWWVSWSGTSAWSQLNTSGYTLGSLAFADFDGDGKSEVFRANGSQWWVSWSGTGSWSQLKTDSNTLSNLAFADFNNDGESDVFRTDNYDWSVSSSGTSAWAPLDGCPTGSRKDFERECVCDANTAVGGTCKCGDQTCNVGGKCQVCAGEIWGCVLDVPTQCCAQNAYPDGCTCLYKGPWIQCSNTPEWTGICLADGWSTEH